VGLPWHCVFPDKYSVYPLVIKHGVLENPPFSSMFLLHFVTSILVGGTLAIVTFDDTGQSFAPWSQSPLALPRYYGNHGQFVDDSTICYRNLK
jgi:hypothetical protein